VGLRVQRLEPLVGLAVGLRAGGEVGDPHVVGEAGVGELLGVALAVQHDLDRVAVGVLGEVEPERLQPRAARAAAGLDVGELLLLPVAGLDGLEVDRQRGARRGAAEAAGPGRRAPGRR
jgi:hypothetical protein